MENRPSERDGLEVRPVRCPASIGAAARMLREKHEIVGNLQTSALRHALQCGAILHWVKSQKEHGEWMPWLETNFKGTDRRANHYVQIAVAYSNNPSDFDATQTIEEALQLARTMPKPKDLPAVLPGLMEPRTLRAVPQPQSKPAEREPAEREPEPLEPVINRTEPTYQPVAQASPPEDEDLRVNRTWQEARREDQERQEARHHPHTERGSAARRAERLLTQAVATEGAESEAFARKAVEVIKNYHLEIKVIGS